MFLAFTDFKTIVNLDTINYAVVRTNSDGTMSMTIEFMHTPNPLVIGPLSAEEAATYFSELSLNMPDLITTGRK